MLARSSKMFAGLAAAGTATAAVAFSSEANAETKSLYSMVQSIAAAADRIEQRLDTTTRKLKTLDDYPRVGAWGEKQNFLSFPSY